MKILLNKIPPHDLPDNTVVGIDSETSRMDKNKIHRPTTGEFACMSINFNDETSYVITDENLVDMALQRLQGKIWAIHKAKHDLTQFSRYSNITPNRLWCSLTMDRILWNGYYSGFSLGDLSRRYLDVYVPKDIRDTFATHEGEMTQEQVEYAAWDAYYHRQVALAQQEEIKTNPTAWKIYREVDLPCLRAIMDFQGFRVDVDAWKKLADENEHKKMSIENELPFNPRSHVQVKEFFKKEYGVTLKGTGKDYLLKRKGKSGWEVAQAILECRMYGVRTSTFGHNWLDKYVEQEGDLHLIYSDFDVNRAKTGRFASSDPNSQNIPARETPEFRVCFIPRPGNVLIVADYSAQEPRITAHITQDPTMLQIFRDGKDIYNTMRQMYMDSTGKSDPGRSNMKPVILGMTYGLTKWGMAKKNDINLDLSEEFLGLAHNMFPTTSRHMEMLGNENNYVETVLGRRCHLNPYYSQSDNLGRNAPIQGTAADMLKKAIVTLHRTWDFDCPFGVVAPVHDELVLDVPKKLAPQIQKRVSEVMVSEAEAMCPSVPFKADAIICDNWAGGKG